MDKLRRHLLAGTALMVALRPALATPEEQAAAIKAFTGGAVPREGKVKLEVPQLVDNGNAVPLTVSVDSPMTANEHVAAIAIFNERNPQVDVATFMLGPRAGKAVVSTRIRLATSQKLVAVARMSDGSYWSGSASMVVTLAACVEGEG
jgi:sulfur-oxidizing protein SoxY